MLSKKAIATITVIGLLVMFLGLLMINTHLVVVQVTLETNLLVGLIIFMATCLVLYSALHFDYHTIILTPIRREAQFALSSIVIHEWNVDLKLKIDGSAEIKHEIEGKVNFGKNRWMVLGISADAPQEEGLRPGIQVTNLETGRNIKPEFIQDYPDYKKVRIYFDRVLKRGDKFHYKIGYNLHSCFFFDREDYYAQKASHYEKRITINVGFPPEVDIERAWSEIVTEQGDTWVRHKQPSFGPHYINWIINKAQAHNTHYVRWITRTIAPPKAGENVKN